MVSIYRVPAFALARIKQGGIDGLRNLVDPSATFRKLTGRQARSIVAPTSRGHNSRLWRVETRTGEYLKLYCLRHDQSAAEMVALLNVLDENGIRVPRILEFDEGSGWIVAEWIAGTPLSLADARDANTLAEVARFQARQNGISFPQTPNVRTFSYFHHMVLERYLHWTQIRFGSAVAAINAQLVEDLARRWPLAPEAERVVITNPDFSFDNLVRDEEGNLAIIDTEFLTADSSAAFELANLLTRTRRVGDDFERQYLSAYGRNATMDAYSNSREFWHACVELKQVGKQAIFLRSSDTDLLDRIRNIGEVVSAN